MARLGLNQVPIEVLEGTNDPVETPQADKNPLRTVSYRKSAEVLGMTVWRPGDALLQGYRSDPTIMELEDSEKTSIRALCEFLIQNTHKALLIFGGQVLPNNSDWRSATGGDSAWRQVNFSDWNQARMPASSWALRWSYESAVFDHMKQYFLDRGHDWSHYIQGELTNEPSVIVTPGLVETVVTGNFSIGSTSIDVADVSGFSHGDFVTVQGSGSWQTFEIDQVEVSGGASGSLSILANSCSSDYGNTKSDGLVVTVANGTVLGKCQYRSSHFGSLDVGVLDEMDADATNWKTRYPELFLWGPALAGGHPDSISALFSTNRDFLNLCDGFNFHCYAKSGVYTGDEQWHGLSEPSGETLNGFLSGLLAPFFAIIRRYRMYTEKPLMCSECGFAASALKFGSSGYREFSDQLFAQAFYYGVDALAELPLEQLVLWGPDRDRLGSKKDSRDWLSSEPSKDSAAALLNHAFLAMRRSGTSSSTVPTGFANAGASTGL